MAGVANSPPIGKRRNFKRLLLRGVCIYAGMGAVTACSSLHDEALDAHGSGAKLGGKRVEVNGSLASGLRLAESMRESGGHQAAIALYSGLIEKHPGDIEPVVGIAESLHEIGRYYDAMDFAMEAVALADADSRGHALAGRASLGLRDPYQALEHFDAALARNAQDLDALNGRGVAYQILGQHTQARAAFEAALELQPDSIPIRSNLALSYVLAGDFNRGIPMLGELAHSPLAPARVRQNLALALALKGDEEGARNVGGMDLSRHDFNRNLEFLAGIRAPAAGSEQFASAEVAAAPALEDLPPKVVAAPLQVVERAPLEKREPAQHEPTPAQAPEPAPAPVPDPVRAAAARPLDLTEVQIAQSPTPVAREETAPVTPPARRPEAPVSVGRIWSLENARWLRGADPMPMREDEGQVQSASQEAVLETAEPVAAPAVLPETAPVLETMPASPAVTPVKSLDPGDTLDKLLDYLADPQFAEAHGGDAPTLLEAQHAAAPLSAIEAVEAEVVQENTRVTAVVMAEDEAPITLAARELETLATTGPCAETSPHWIGCFVFGEAEEGSELHQAVAERRASFRALHSCRMCGATELVVKISSQHVCGDCRPDWSARVLEEGLAVRDSLRIILRDETPTKRKLDRIALARRSLERLLPFEERGIATLAVAPSVASAQLEALRRYLIRDLFETLLAEARELTEANGGRESLAACRRTLKILKSELAREPEGQVRALSPERLACIAALEGELERISI